MFRFHTPPPQDLSPRDVEEKRLRAEANGSIYAPVKGEDANNNNRNKKIEEYVIDGLVKFDEQQAALNNFNL